MPTLDSVLTERLEMLVQSHVKRQIRTTHSHDGVHVTQNGKELISFSSNDYLGLSHHPALLQAALKATEEYGTGAGASRLITGNHPLYDSLESSLATYKGSEAACIFGSGYLANIGTITALMQPGDLILADKLSHACIIDGARLSGATFKRFAHNDMAHLERLLEEHRDAHKHCLIITETVFSMDGDLAPIAEIQTLAQGYDSWTLSDDAHGLGIVDSPKTDIMIGTLSKALGGYGGYVCASQTIIDFLKTSARSLIFSTGLPPATIASSIAALECMQTEPERAQKALENAQLFTSSLSLPTAQSTIVPLIIGESDKALQAAQQLETDGLLVGAIRPPTVPPGTARLRVAFSANHATPYIEQLIDCITRYGWT